jgi:hypothetical protein
MLNFRNLLQRLRRSGQASLLCTLASLAQASPQLLVPAYFYPSFDPAQSQWDEMTAAAAQGARITAIMNVANGAGDAPNSDYVAAVNAFRAAGGRVLGYVYTCYGGSQCFTGLPPTRSTAQVLADAQNYADWSGVDGIFLDEMSNRLADLNFYATVASAMRSAHPNWLLVGNPGVSTPAQYLDVADTLVTFEGNASRWANRPSEPWMTQADPSRQAALFYEVDDSSAMQQLLQQALAARAGYVYLTDDQLQPNPWDRLPSYWQALAAATVPAAAPEPTPLLLLMAAAGAWALRRKPRVGPVLPC